MKHWGKIMKEYNIKELLRSDTVINCKTEKQAKKFIKKLQILGYNWEWGDILSPQNTYYNIYEEKTCYILTTYGTVMYGDIEHLIALGYRILTLKDIK